MAGRQPLEATFRFSSTTAIDNAGVGAFQKVRACRAAPQNLLDFAFASKKVKTKRFR